MPGAPREIGRERGIEKKRIEAQPREMKMSYPDR